MSVLEKQIGPCHIALLSAEGGRSVNQDCYGSWGTEDGEFGCWVVADGLGGHRGGEIASALAVEAIVERFKRYPVFSPEAIKEALDRAQAAILKGQQKDSRHYTMRTTVVVLLIAGNHALWGHVGDSRLYHFREHLRLFQTKDHSVTQAFYDAGHISTKQIRTDENRSRLTSVLGKDEEFKSTIQKQPVQLTAQDSFLLCTDGFWEHVEEEAMQADLHQSWSGSPKDWLEDLEKRILQVATGEFDNYTAYAVFFRPAPGSLPQIAAPPAAAEPTVAEPTAAEATAAPPKHPVRGTAAASGDKRIKALAAVGFLLLSLAVLAYFFLPTEYIPQASGPNRPPIAKDDTVTTDPDVSVSIPVLENDEDPDQDELQLAAVGTPTHGTVTFEGQVLHYTPNLGVVGKRDSFSYEVTDGTAYVRGAVEVRINAPPGSITPPDPKDDKAATPPDTAVPIAVLDNDYDANGDTLMISELEQPAHGSAKKQSDGSVLYTPDPGFNGVDTFRYEVSDGRDQVWATVRVTVETPNQLPEGVDDLAETKAGQPVTVPVLQNDSDPDSGPEPLQVIKIEATTGGTAIIHDGGKSVVFTPKAGFSGEATFIYVVTDGKAETRAKATVKVKVVPPLVAPPPPAPENRPPKAQPDHIDSSDLRLIIDVLANDTDPEKQPLTLQAVSKPGHGTAKVQEGKVLYQREPSFQGKVEFIYTVSDGQKEATGAVTVTFAKALDSGFVLEPPRGLSYAWIPGNRGKNIAPFWLGRTEVTRDAYRKFVTAKGQSMPFQGAGPDGKNYPVVEVTWTDAKKFCEWSGGRLPTKEEWLFAAMADRIENKFPWGNSTKPNCTLGASDGANFNGCNKDAPIPVSRFGTNEFKLHDMIGNVREWCDEKIVLGGSYKSKKSLFDGRKHLDGVSPEEGKPLPDVGFRCARDKAP